MLLRVRKVEQDALARLYGERDAAVLDQVQRDVVACAPEEVLLTLADVRKRIVPVHDAAVVGDQNGIEQRRTGLAVIAAENAQQNTVLSGEDLLEPLELEARGGEAVGVSGRDRRCSW